jgi:hypothetical protein
MKKLTITLTAAALALGTLAVTASAQTQRLGAASLHAQIQNFTPIITQIACNGTTGVHGCGPGWFWRYGGRGWACYRC